MAKPLKASASVGADCWMTLHADDSKKPVVMLVMNRWRPAVKYQFTYLATLCDPASGGVFVWSSIPEAQEMSELLSRTERIRRRLIDRLMGFERLYETKVTDGQRVAYGRGATPKTSQQWAQRNWDARFGRDAKLADGV
jgi:hypothetical protein